MADRRHSRLQVPLLHRRLLTGDTCRWLDSRSTPYLSVKSSSAVAVLLDIDK